MKLLALAVVVGCQAVAFASPAVCQENKSQSDRPYLAYSESPQLNFTILTTADIGRVEFVASSADRTLTTTPDPTSAEIQSVLQLRGNVKVTICPPGGHGCDAGVMVLHADTVDYNEMTGEIDAHGDVHIEPYQRHLH
jgi:hypothetical protein